MRSSTLAFLLGILACQNLSHLPDIRLTLLIFPLLPAAVIYPRLRFPILVLLGFLWTVWRANLILTPPFPEEIVGQAVLVTGSIIDIPVPTNKGWRFDFIPTQLLFQGQTQPLPGKLRLSWNGQPPQPLRPGQTWELTVRLKTPHVSLNPGVFDYSTVLFQKKIRATGYVRDKYEPRYQYKPRLLNPPSQFNIDNWRYSLAKEIKKVLGDQPSTAIIIALAVGYQEEIKPDSWEIMKRTGIVHVVSVSGLHISLVALLCFGIANRLWRYFGHAALWLPARYVATVAGLFAACGYALLAGFSIPTQRSLVMIIVAMLGTLLTRRITGSSILAGALLAVLVYDPLAVMSIGFWLSFGAVAVMIYALSDRRPPVVSRLTRWGTNAVTTQWAVTLGLFPSLLAWSGNISTIITSPVANSVAIPWFNVVTVLVLISTCSILLLPNFSSFLLQISAGILDALWIFLTWLVSFNWTLWLYNYTSGGGRTVGIATIGVILLLSPLPWHFIPKWLGLLWLLPLFFWPRDLPKAGEAWFTLLDVGQGLAAVIRTEKHLLVYDTGPRFSDKFDAGKTVVIPFLHHQGLFAIDKLIITHGDADHSGGAQSILKELTVDEILTSATDKFSHHHQNVHPCQAGQHWQWEGVNFQILHPSQDFVLKSNNRACILKVSTARSSLLLTGDIEKLIEYRLIHDYPQALSADILVVPHHGSKTSSSDSFIDQVRPKIALFSTGYLNSFKHPAPAVVQRYRQRQITVLNTAEQGAIMFRLTAEGLSQPRLARVDMRRYWHE